MRLPRFVVTLLAIAGTLAGSSARADEPIAPKPPPPNLSTFTIESFDTALTAYQQRGHGYQSKAGQKSLSDPGSSALEVFQPQLLVVARQGEHIVHRFWMPIDIVTSASANAIDRGRGAGPDMVSNSSRQNEAAAIDWHVAYETPRWTTSIHNNLHVEENFGSWTAGIGATFNLADNDATVSASANQVLDWFSGYDGFGNKIGRQQRGTSNANVGLTQILTPTTIVHANYGLSTQSGTLSNTWNTAPFDLGFRLAEVVPRNRIRHALVGRFAQWLPWNGTLKGFYRYYTDDWGVRAHAIEGQLLQRIHPLVYLRGSYRFYSQTAVDFFTTHAVLSDTFFTADSDLAKFTSQTVGGKAVFELPFLFKGAHADVGYERYWRSDGLRVNVALWQGGARF